LGDRNKASAHAYTHAYTNANSDTYTYTQVSTCDYTAWILARTDFVIRARCGRYEEIYIREEKQANKNFSFLLKSVKGGKKTDGENARREAKEKRQCES